MENVSTRKLIIQMDNELILIDRLNIIKDVINDYWEDSFYISFSGGKDSTVLHHLVDMALPNNKIPRVYSNTGIEYIKITEFVKSLAEKDDRFIILKPTTNIKKMLEEKGYPFKSKEYSHWIQIYQSNADEINKYMEMVENDKSLLDNFDFIHNLPKGVKTAIKSYYGIRERESCICTSSLHIPNKLKYQFNKNFKLKLSDKCCLEIKEKPIRKWELANNRRNKLLGLMASEGGRRALRGKCRTFKSDGMTFSPLIKVTEEWEQWFIDTYHIQLCELYYPPYNFERTGCKGCPYSLNLQEQLDVMDKLLPNEKQQCELIWKPVYEEYRRIGYRLKERKDR